MQTSFTPEQLRDPEMATSESAIRKCVHCGFCTATCPTYVLLGDELDSPRGRIYLIKEMLENEQQPTAETVKHIDRCLSCLACRTTCPSGVDYMRLIDHARDYVEKRYARPFGERVLRALLAFVLPSSGRFRAALVLARPLRPLAAVLEKLSPLKPAAAMLRLAPRKQMPAPKVDVARKSGTRGRVALLQGCAEPVLQPQVREATARLIQRLGFELSLGGDACCGALVHHLGRSEQALAAARRNVDAWWREHQRDPLTAIVITASGCGTTVKDYGHMLRHDPDYAERAACIAALAKDVSEFLSEVELPPPQVSRLRVAYHAPCSLQHGQRAGDVGKNLLQRAGFDVRAPAESHLCCGSAGVYNILQPEIAGALGARKAANLAALAPDLIAAGNVGCAIQISQSTGLPIVHPVELLDWAYGGLKPVALNNLRGLTDND